MFTVLIDQKHESKLPMCPNQLQKHSNVKKNRRGTLKIMKNTYEMTMSTRLRGTERKPLVVSIRVRDAVSEIKAHQSAQTCIYKLENNFRIMLIISYSTVTSTLRDALCNNIRFGRS